MYESVNTFSRNNAIEIRYGRVAGSMDYFDARRYVDDVMAGRGSVLGLDAVRELLRRMDNPQNKVPVVHIAGTNGKGSAVSFISSILRQAGYKTGIYISPSVFEYRERIQINGCNISEKEYAEEISVVKNHVDEMERDMIGAPTAFEMETAAAFHYFYKNRCDIAVIETGMGGRDDATNVCNSPLVSAIMSVSKDHTAFLGDTIEEIASCKAGIIKTGCPVVLYRQDESVINVIRRFAEEKASLLKITEKVSEVKYHKDITEFDYKSSKDLYKSLNIQMAGTFQPDNAAVAVEIAELLRDKGFFISRENIYNGLKTALWHGRFEKIGDKPLFYIDGAHNPGASKCLKSNIETYFKDYFVIFIMGVLADKDFDEVVQDTVPLADYIFAITPNNSRALPAEKLAAAVQKISKKVIVPESIDEAVVQAIELSEKAEDKESVILAFGSLSYLGEFKNSYDKSVKCEGKH
ncbi:MAG: bifunctional folylpolyglutamate synthase/dihydrofolate synthase [Lachnospiraceae bacterium]|nr:bifunctional folylpolyglutamate synthase/dihydrofolate synthase [Lachnospiraceae bacterium]